MSARFRPVSIVIGCGFWAFATAASGSELESPFVPSLKGEAAAPASGDPLRTLEFAGVASVNGETSVYLRDSTRATGRWFRVGVATDGVFAEEYDREREAVFVRAGERGRWLNLPQAVVTALPVARLADGTVDWTYMKLSEKSKETEAMHFMQDIMYVSMTGTAGAGVNSPATQVADSKATISPVR